MGINIGTATVLGSIFGGGTGFCEGIAATKSLNLPFKVQRTQVINYTVKRSSSTAQNCGLFVSLYSIIGVALENMRGQDDDYNTIAASTAACGIFFAKKGIKPALAFSAT